MAVTIQEAHAFARERGTSRLVYAVVRAILMPIAKLVFRLKVTGAEYVPAEGGAIIAPNHKSMYDPFFVGLATKRPLHYMSKDDLFDGRSGRLLLDLGAYPVIRGTADPEALETSRIHLEARPPARAVPRGHAGPRSGRPARPAPRRRAARARDAGADRPVRDHRAPTACSSAASRARSRSPSRPRSSRPSSRRRPRRPRS